MNRTKSLRRGGAVGWCRWMLAGMVLLILPQAAAAEGWSRAPDMPTCRSEIAATVLQGKIFVAGGLGPRGTQNAFEAFDPKWRKWVVLAPTPSTFHHFGMTVFGDRIFITGGYTGLPFGVPSKETWAYDVTGNNWKRKADMPGPRAAHTMVAMGGKLLVVGGVPLQKIWVYDPETNTWELPRPAPPTRREHLAAAVKGGLLYVVGGRWNGKNQAALEVYDPATRRWRALAPMPTARGGATAAFVGAQLHVTGGEDLATAETYSAHEVYDPVSGKWRAAPPLPTARHGAASVAVRDQWYVIGGATAAGYSTLKTSTCTVDVFQP